MNEQDKFFRSLRYGCNALLLIALVLFLILFAMTVAH